MSATEPPNGQYYDYTAQSQYIQNSPDTFYGQVTVQPPTRTTSDSTNSADTPPSHTPKSRRSVARPSQSQSQSQSTHSRNYNNVDSLDLNSSRGPSAQVRKDRERQLSTTSKEALIRLAIKREYEIKKAKQLLTTAVLQLEDTKEKLAREVEARKLLEEEKHLSSIKTTQAIINAQTDSINVQHEVGTYRLQVTNMQRELNRAKDVVRAVEDERNKAEQALARSRSNMRQVKEENVLLVAREEGRREGFEEGLRQGRIALASVEPTEEPSSSKARKEKHSSRKRSHTPPPAGPSPAMLEELRRIEERDKIIVKQQLAATAMERDAAIQRTKDVGQAAQREKIKFEEDKKRLEEDKKRGEAEMEHERRARQDAEKEKETVKRIDEARIKQLEEDRRMILAAKDKELEGLRKDKQKLEKDNMAALELARKEVAMERERNKKLEEDRERERERERLKEARELEREKEKEKENTAALAAAVTAAVVAAKSSSSSHRHGSSRSSMKSSPAEPPYEKIPYHPMPAPPMVPGPGMPVPIVMPSASGGVPRATSSGSRGYGRDRRMSIGSYSSMTSGLPLEMLQLPSDMRGGDLSVIPEDASMRGASPARPEVPAPPMWTSNPPPNFNRGEGMETWRSNVGSAAGEQYGSHAPISMPRAPGDGPEYAGPITMPRAPGDGPAYQTPITMPRAPMDGVAFTTSAPGGSAGYQTPSNNYSGGPVTMPRAPGEGPSSYQPPPGMPVAPGETPGSYRPPVTMPVAPGEGPSSYVPPMTMPSAPGEGPPSYKPPITMPTAPGEGPATYKPSLTMPTAPGEGPSTYKPPVMMPTVPGEGPSTYHPPLAMPTAPGEGPSSYRPPVGISTAPGEGPNGHTSYISMPTAPGEGPTSYRPPAGFGQAPGEQAGYQPPPSMPRAPGEGPDYHPPAVLPPAPGEVGYQTPITMPRAPADGVAYTPPVMMPKAPGDGSGYQPAMPRAPADGPGYMPPANGYDAPISMPRAPGDGPGPAYAPRSHTPSISMPRAPGDGPGPAYTPGAQSSIAMPRAPADGPGSAYTPRSQSASISMPRAPVDGPGPAYTPRSHTPSISMPRAPADGMSSAYTPRSQSASLSMPRAPADGPSGAYTPRSTSISMPRAPGDGPGYVPPINVSQGPGGGGPMTMPRAPSDGQGYPSRSHTPSIGVPRAPSDGFGRTSRSHTPSISMPRAPGDGAGFEPPVIIPRPPSSAGQRSYAGGNNYVPNKGLLSPHTSNRNGPVRRPSTASTGSYEILIQPPSRSPSILEGELDQDVHSYLSPNHRPIALPQTQPVQKQPIEQSTRSRGQRTQPNSPIAAPFGLPPNFVPQTLTDRNGISTPISHPSVLPGMGQPVIPRPPSSQGNGVYGNPLANRGRDSPPAALTRSPFIPSTALSGSGSPNMGNWGLPGRTGSHGSNDNGGQRTPSIYGPPVSAGGFSPNVRNSPMVMTMPIPTVRAGNDEDDDGFDQATLNNTRLNTMAMPVPTTTKKKKKARK